MFETKNTVHLLFRFDFIDQAGSLLALETHAAFLRQSAWLRRLLI